MKWTRPLALTIALASCTAPRGPTTFVIETDRPLGVREVARIARVLGEYRDLTPRELAEATERLRRAVDDLVEIEFQQLKRAKLAKPALAAPKQRIDRIAPTPLPTPALTVADERDLRAEARERVLARLGKELALPMLHTENKSVVMFGAIKGDQVEMTPTAYELDHVAGMPLPIGTQIVQKDGDRATLVQPMAK